MLETGKKLHFRYRGITCFTDASQPVQFERKIVVDNKVLPTTSKFNYLGHVLNFKNNDSDDVERLRVSYYRKYYSAYWPVKTATTEVRTKIFQAHCLHLYGSDIWHNFFESELLIVKRALDSGFKNVFGLSKFESTTIAFGERNVLPFVYRLKVKQINFYFRFMDLCRTNRVAFASFISSAYDSCSQWLLRQYNLHRVFIGEVRPTDVKNVVESSFKRKYNQRLTIE